MRTRMVSLQTLRKRNCKVGFLIILGKEELKCALYVGQAWLYGPKTNTLRYRPRKWGWWMSKGVVFISSVPSGSTRPNSISILAWPKYIYAWCCLRAQKSPTVFHPYGFPTNLERSWIEFPKSWSEQKRTGLQFELGKILFDQCSRVSSARVFFYWKTDYIVPWVGWIK